MRRVQWLRTYGKRWLEETPVTETEWLASEDPRPMLEWLRHTQKASDRRLRLFGCACVRQVWHLLGDQRAEYAVEVAEAYADASVGKLDLTKAGELALEAPNVARFFVLGIQDELGPTLKACGAAISVTNEDAWAAASRASDLAVQAGHIPRRAQCDLIRDIAGDLFRTAPVVDSSWFTPTVRSFAQRVYDERAFERLPELADALERAGCHNREVLDHCRLAGEHVRGCCVVDLILDKH
jgi:hypothetical protein